MFYTSVDHLWREKLFMQSDSYFVNGNIVYENGSFSRFSADQKVKV
jgi:hypothetical protein